MYDVLKTSVFAVDRQIADVGSDDADADEVIHVLVLNGSHLCNKINSQPTASMQLYRQHLDQSINQSMNLYSAASRYLLRDAPDPGLVKKKSLEVVAE